MLYIDTDFLDKNSFFKKKRWAKHVFTDLLLVHCRVYEQFKLHLTIGVETAFPG